jgi:hypothetical protein
MGLASDAEDVRKRDHPWQLKQVCFRVLPLLK